jgi:predicted transposase YdaD
MYVSVFERVYTEKGKEEGRAEIARNMLGKGFSAKEVLEYTGMLHEELAALTGETVNSGSRT